jgi:hypothetical protein
LSRDELRYVLDPQEVYGSDFRGTGEFGWFFLRAPDGNIFVIEQFTD